jgi:hypothetical protein
VISKGNFDAAETGSALNALKFQKMFLINFEENGLSSSYDPKWQAFKNVHVILVRPLTGEYTKQAFVMYFFI